MMDNHGMPHDGQTLFTSKGKKFEVAHIGQGNNLEQLLDYVHGYLFAADALLDTVDDDFTHSKEMAQHLLDLYAMPICFLYRQYLELSLKEIFLEYSSVSLAEQQKMLAETKHDLKKAFMCAKPIIDGVLKDDEKKYLLSFENYVMQFHANDISSEKYRYPFGKQLNTITINSKINLCNLKKRMEEIENFFCYVMPLLDIKRLQDESINARNVALMFWDEKKLPEAIDAYLEALKQKRNMVGEKHYDMIIGNVEIGILYLQNEQFKESYEYLKKAVSIYDEIKDSMPTKNYDISVALNFLGLICKLAGKYQDAVEYYTQALNSSCVDTSQIVIAYKGIARVYKKQDDKKHAIEYLGKAVDVCEANYGAEHEETNEVKNELHVLTGIK